MRKNERKDAVQLMVRFVRGSLGLFALGLICSMLNTACNSLTPQIIRMTVDSVIGSGEDAGMVSNFGFGPSDAERCQKVSCCLQLPQCW